MIEKKLQTKDKKRKASFSQSENIQNSFFRNEEENYKNNLIACELTKGRNE